MIGAFPLRARGIGTIMQSLAFRFANAYTTQVLPTKHRMLVPDVGRNWQALWDCRGAWRVRMKPFCALPNCPSENAD